MAKLLFADDDKGLCETAKEWFKLENYLVDLVKDGDDAIEHLKSFNYDAIVLDWDMPGASGVEVCKNYRARGGNSPILILTGKDKVEDKELGLDSGADDYLTKPFHFEELSARLRSLMRRPAQLSAQTLKVRDLVLHPGQRTVEKAGKEVTLQRLEYAVLEFLVKHPRQAYTPEMLLHHIWGSESEVSHDAIYACIRRLRKKIDADEDNPLIVSSYGAGYRLEP